ncbi:MAG: hypothetical protein U0790_17520 [Isosphaeraceae bacterium]
MSSLYCKIHGRQKEAEAISDNDSMCKAGESVLIVHGRLISGPWLCDRCNAELNEGTEAYFEAIYPSTVTEGIFAYDFSYEREYFALDDEDDMAVYGAPWPGGEPRELLEDSRLRELEQESYLRELEEEDAL